MSDTNQGKKRVLISGAGIAGLTTAFWLERQGWEVVILEKAATLRKGEYTIDFAGTGWDVADRMGILDKVRESRIPIRKMVFKDGAGVEKSSLSMESLLQSMGVLGKYAALNRCDLEELLYDQVKDKASVAVLFESSIEAMEESDTSVTVTLSSGETETYDLVIGADGLHSNVRRLVFGEEEEYTRYLGYNVATYRMPRLTSSDDGAFVMARQPGKQAGLVQMEEGDALAYFVFQRESDAYVPRSERAALLRDTFGSMGWLVPEMLAYLDQQDVSMYMDTATQIEMPSWHTKRVALVGDAAYCLTLISGQGASMAMGGAYALAEALEHQDDLSVGLAQYDARLRPFVEELQAKTRRFSKNFVPSSRFGLWITAFATRWMSVGFVQRYVAKQFGIESIFTKEARALAD